MELRRNWRVWLCSLLLACAAFLPAEDEDVYKQARRLATSGQRPEAIRLLQEQLREHPRDVDARLLYGIFHSWDGNYEESRRALGAVLETSPDYSDAREALIRVEMWSNNPGKAEMLAREGQSRQPGNLAYLIARIKALIKMKRDKEAFELTTNLLQLEPDNQDARNLKETLDENKRKWDAGMDQFYSWFSDGRNAWHESSIFFKRMTPVGRAGFSFERANHYGITSQLMELDFYPRIRRGTYLYLNAGFSPDHRLYPSYRIAGEIFQNLPLSMEGSFGFRRFRFNSPFTLYTSSLGRYFGSYLFTARTFFSYDADGLHPSYQFYARRYFRDHERFIGLRYGIGSSPFEVRSVNEVGILRANTVVGEVSGKIAGRWLYRGALGVSIQDRFARAAIRQYIMDGSLQYRF